MVSLARDIAGNALLSRTIAGERVLFFRNADGSIAALIDKCPHRGAALSLGKLRDGIIECPFHGWRFDGSGRNCGVPWNPEAKREALGATALPAREAGGLIWLYTGRTAQEEPSPSDALLRENTSICAQSVVWNVHWSRVMENMLDSPHVPFVHRRTIGKRMTVGPGDRMAVEWVPQPYGAQILNRTRADASATRLDYRFPNAMELFLDSPSRLFRMMAICTPETPERTRLTIYTIRSFARWRLLDPVFKLMNARIAGEDRRVIESSLPTEVPLPSQERSVRTDAPTLAFRKIYFERLKGQATLPSSARGVRRRP